MKPILLITLTLALTLPVYAQDTNKPISAKEKPDPQAAFAKKDKNSDGFLSKEEFVGKAKDPAKGEASFAKKDKNSDGEISLEEFAGKAKQDPE